MTFFNGNTDTDALLNLWANELIATGAWVDNDPTWNTTRRSLRHAVDPGFYISFSRVSTLLQTSTGNGIYTTLEIQIVVSSAWVANAPSGTIRYTGLPIQAHNTNTGSGSGGELPRFGGNEADTARTGQHWTWVDAEGVVSLFRATTSASWDFTSLFILDRITAKEYADGGSNFHVICDNNYDPFATSNGSPGTTRAGYFDQDFGSLSAQTRHRYIRPFLTESTVLVDGVERYVGAFRSTGNSKAYFVFPFYSNTNTQPQRSPIAITDKWLLATQAQGLADGDILDYTAPGPLLKRYLVKTVDSPDNLTAIEIAMRFA